MQNWLPFFHRALSETWAIIVDGRSFSKLLIVALTITVTFLLFQNFRGKEYAKDWVTDLFIFVSATIIVGVAVFFVELLIVAPSEMYGEVNSQNEVLTNRVASLTASNTLLSTEKDVLQKKQEKAESMLDTVAIVAGFTNAPFTEKLDKFLSKFDEMQRQLTNTASQIFKEQEERYVVETVTNLVDGNKIVLKYEPIPQTVIIKIAYYDAIIPYIPFPSERDDLANMDGHTITIKTNGELLKVSLEERSRAINKSIAELRSQGITNYVTRPDFRPQVIETEVSQGKTNYMVHIGIASVEYTRKSLR